MSTRFIFPLIGLLSFLWSGNSLADNTYTDPSGFSIAYSEDWTKVSAEDLKKVVQEIAPAGIKDSINKVTMSITLVNKRETAFRQNMNISIMDRELPLKDGSPTKVLDEMLLQSKLSGIPMKNVKTRFEKVNSNEAFVIEFESQQHGLSLFQRQYLIPSNGKTFFLTCTDAKEYFKGDWSAFEPILASFQPPKGQPWYEKITMTEAAIAGVGVTFLIVIVGTLLGSMFRMAKAKPKSTDTPKPFTYDDIPERFRPTSYENRGS